MADSKTTQAPTPESNLPDSNLGVPDSSTRVAMQLTAAPREDGTTEALSEPAPRGPQPGVLAEQPTQISRQPPVSDSSLPGLPPASSIAQALVGSSLLHFDIEQFVGGGGMGAVFRGLDTELDRTVAVKVLSRENIDDDTVRRFRNEAQSAARLNHPNIPNVYYVGADKGWHFIVFEYVEGQNIRDLVAEYGPLSIDDILCYVAQVAETIQHASSRDVVHRDIKPSNVLITPGGRAKLVDMGLARFDQTHSSADDLTATGVTLGTFDYISPEQARDPRVADVRSDIYSLGCTVYYMLTGRPPFPEGTVLQKLLSHTTDAPPDPSQFRTDIPAALARILARMLAKRPDDRYQTPDQLIGEILLLARHRGVPLPGQLASTVVVEREVVRSPAWRNHIAWLAPVLLLVTTAIVLDQRPRGRGDTELPKINIIEGPRVDVPGSLENSPRSESVEPVGEVAGESRVEPSPDATADDSSGAVGLAAGSPEPQRNSESGIASSSHIVDITNGNPAAQAAAGEDLQNGLPASPYPIGSYSPTQIVVGPNSGKVSTDGATIFINSLRGALQLLKSAPSVETIEIRHSDVIELERLELDNRRLTVRAGTGHRPRIVFRPNVEKLAGADSLIEMVGGELQLDGVDLLLVIPEVYAERWSLFKLKNVRLLQLNDSTVTVQNSLGRRASFVEDVAVFELQAAPGARTQQGAEEDAAAVTEIDLQNCVVRGEATLLKVQDSLPARLNFVNGLLVTTERMVSVGGPGQTDDERRFIRLDLRNVTAVMDKGLCIVNSDQDVHRQPTLDIRCSHSILMTDPKWPLIAQRGKGDVDEFHDQLVYYGDRNLIEGTEVFWAIQGESGQPDQQFDFAQWQAYWLDQWRGRGGEPDTTGEVAWQQPPDSADPVHTHDTGDYQLRPSDGSRTGNGSGPESNEAGVRLDQLPELWQPPSAATENGAQETADS